MQPSILESANIQLLKISLADEDYYLRVRVSVI